MGPCDSLFLVVLSGWALCQSDSTLDPTDIVQKLMPSGYLPRVLKLSHAEKAEAVKQLQVAQKRATKKRSQEISFLLAALGSDYEHNRDYLINVLRGCNSTSVKNNCDDDTGAYLIWLYRHGHHEVLQPLMVVGMHSYQAALAETIGAFYADVVTRAPTRFLDALRPLAIPTQKKLCGLAGSTDGGGMAVEDLKMVRKSLRAVDDEVARRCLQEIEKANKNR